MLAGPQKRRKLVYSKCSQCRTDKKKCSPSERQWPQRCNRCIEKDFSCSENASLTKQKRSRARSERVEQSKPTVSRRRSKSPVDLDSTASDWQKWKNFAVRALNNERAVSAAIEQKIDINTQDDNGWTALHWAAVRGDGDAVRFLIAASANPEVQEKCGATPLHYAAHRGSVPVVQKFLDSGADVNKSDTWGWLPLHEAAEKGHLGIVEVLLRNGAHTEAKNHISGDTPLLLAIIEGHLDVVQMIIRHGADPNTPNKSGLTPLMAATMRRPLDIAKAVLCPRTAVNAQDESGSTALHYLLRDRDQDDDCVMLAETLLRANASIDIRNNEGETPLDVLRGLDAVIYADELQTLQDEIFEAQHGGGDPTEWVNG